MRVYVGARNMNSTMICYKNIIISNKQGMVHTSRELEFSANEYYINNVGK